VFFNEFQMLQNLAEPKAAIRRGRLKIPFPRRPALLLCSDS
jgi:hypothetical protein